MRRVDSNRRALRLDVDDRAPIRPPETELADTVAQTAKLLFDGASAAGGHLIELPVFRPTFDRRIPHRLAKDVVSARLLPLIEDIARRKIDLRAQRTEGLPDQLDAIIESARAISSSTDESKDLFDGITDLSNRLERFLKDIDYVTFGQVGLVGQLQALSIMLRTSKSMWTFVRSGYAFRDPRIQRDGMRVLSRAEAVLNRATHALDINRELDELERDYGNLVTRLEDKTGDTLGLPNERAFRNVRRAWRYRERLEAEIVANDDSLSGPLSNEELFAEVRQHGIPSKLITEEIDAHVMPALERLIARTKDQRGELPERIRARAKVLEAQLRSLRHAPAMDIDTAEHQVVTAQREMSALLSDVEQLVKPADAMVRRLRGANEALIGLRGIFTTLRLVEALEDPTVAEETRRIAGRASELIDGAVRIEDLPRALDELEAQIDAFDADLRSRLKIESTPAMDELHRAMSALKRVVRLRLAANEALNPAVRRAIAAAQQPWMSAEKRGPIFDEAMQEPLLDATVGLAVALRELDLGVTFGDVGRRLDRTLRGDTNQEIGAMVAKSPLAFLAHAEFETAFARLDSFVDNIDSPEGRGFVDRSLDIFRAVYEVERDKVAHFAAVIPEDEQVKVATAIGEYTVRSTMILTEWISAQLADPGGEAVADFLDLMVDTSAANLEAFAPTVDPDNFGRSDVIDARRRLAESAKANAKRASAQRIGSLGTRLSDGPGGPYAQRLRAEREKLEQVLTVVQARPEAKEALRDVLADLSATVKMAVNLVQLFGAASNAAMNDRERERVIQTSVERMGPMFIKVMQSLVNMESLIRSASPDALDDTTDPVVRSLAKLQDEVSPLPWSAIQKRIRSSLSIPDDQPLEDNGTKRGRFVSIEKRALKSGSIGQIHRAKIRMEDEDGSERIVDCVIKVLRPGVEEAFENTVRSTRLTLSLVSELLRLDRNGEIFGDIKADAEARLPLIERALHGFIESFRVETDFGIEVANLRAFEEMFRGDPHVVVPEVYDSHTADGVLTMQELKGFKLSKWTDRYEMAARQPDLVEALGPIRGEGKDVAVATRAVRWAKQTLGLNRPTAEIIRRRRRSITASVTGYDENGRAVREELTIRTSTGRVTVAGYAGGPSEDAARKKAELFATKKFGLAVMDVQTMATPTGVRCRVCFDDEMQKSIEVFVARPSGEVTTDAVLPALTRRGAESLRDRLRQTFLVQLLRGMLHGDPHEGNFFVMADGRTIGLIDFGLALDVSLLDSKGPLALMAGAILESPIQMAEAVLDLSTARDLEGQAREEALAPLVQFFAQLRDEARVSSKRKGRGPIARIRERFSAAKTVVGRALEAIQGAGLVPLPRVIHGIKAVFAMSGNIERLAGFDDRKPSLSRKLGLLGRSWITRAIAPFVGKRRIEAKRRHVERLGQMDVPRFALARGPPSTSAATGEAERNPAA